jgi:hypothetical protein
MSTEIIVLPKILGKEEEITLLSGVLKFPLSIASRGCEKYE